MSKLVLDEQAHQSDGFTKRTWEVFVGRRPPPATTMPPTAVKPEMAFVTDMSGECNAGVTPQTVWYPQMLASPNFVSIELN